LSLEQEIERLKDKDKWTDERLKSLYERPGWGTDGIWEYMWGCLAMQEIERRKNES